MYSRLDHEYQVPVTSLCIVMKAVHEPFENVTVGFLPFPHTVSIVRVRVFSANVLYAVVRAFDLP